MQAVQLLECKCYSASGVVQLVECKCSVQELHCKYLLHLGISVDQFGII